jgi:hypothetical protein
MAGSVGVREKMVLCRRAPAMEVSSCRALLLEVCKKAGMQKHIVCNFSVDCLGVQVAEQRPL